MRLDGSGPWLSAPGTLWCSHTRTHRGPDAGRGKLGTDKDQAFRLLGCPTVFSYKISHSTVPSEDKTIQLLE